MEPWITVAVAVIVALSTLGATWLQNRHSNQRFKIEIGRAIDVDKRKRSWEVRSEPLLELRKALARMVNNQDRFAGAIYLSQVSNILGSEEEAKKEFERAFDDSKAPSSDDELTLTLGMLGDTELVQRVRDIWIEYLQKSTAAVLVYQDEAKSFEAIKDFERIRKNIAEVQELINKRLENL